jgi:hypothetical protein
MDQKIFQKQEYLRLNKYLELIRTSINTTIGELQLFWKREEKRTQKSLEKFI